MTTEANPRASKILHPPAAKSPPDDDGTPPKRFVPQSGNDQDGLATTGNSLGSLMLIGASLLAAGGAALILYRVATRARKPGGDADG